MKFSSGPATVTGELTCNKPLFSRAAKSLKKNGKGQESFDPESQETCRVRKKQAYGLMGG